MVGDCVGKKFNRLTVLEEYRKSNKTYCMCKCDCGNIKEIWKASIVDETTKSCGCWCSEKAKETIVINSKLNKKIQYEKYNKEYYENNEVRRISFKRACDRNGWNFDDFNEIWLNNKDKTYNKLYIYVYKY